MALRLNLASGTDIKDGWQNLDIVPRWPLATRGCDVVWDARKDALPYADGTVSEVYAGYLFLHVPPRHHQRLIADIYRVLRSGGVLVVGEVDMAKVMPRWLDDPGSKNLSELIWGEGGDVHGAEFEDFDRHVWGWTESKLRRFLEQAGFRSISRTSIHAAGVWYELTLVGVR